MPDFPTTLRRERELAGYGSARAFFKTRGRPLLGCSYRSYLDIEAGRFLPQPRLALRIATALGLRENRERAREFVASYLRSLVNDEELASLLVRALSQARAPRRSSPLAKAAGLVFAGETVALTERQAELLCGSPQRYWAFTILTDDKGAWTPAALGKTLGYPEKRMAAALQELASAGLLAKRREGSYHCPRAGKVFVYPRDKFFAPLYMPKLAALWEDKARNGGEVLLHRQLLIRASEARLRHYFPHLAQSIYGSTIYGVTERGPDTAFVTVTGSVRRLGPA